MKKLPTLYKKASTGKIQQWTISADLVDIGERGETGGGLTGNEGQITTVHGQVGGKLQTTTDIIYKGKNIGKANETSPLEQAELEAVAKWEKQKKKGYVETKDGAVAGEVDELIEGGINPMLAHPFSKQAAKIEYPAYTQPKLDGIRCVGIYENGECTLWSRTRKLIKGVPHISLEIVSILKGLNFPKGTSLILDGELYNHDFKADFEKIVSFVRQEEPAEGHEVVEFHVYDVVNDQPYSDRLQGLKEFFKNVPKNSPLKLVETHLIDPDHVMDWFHTWRAAGYEGSMLRNAQGLYANKRSYDLQKVKEFDDAEFDIVGIEEGRGKLAGCAIFKCVTKDGAEFLAKLKGAEARLKMLFENHKLWKGKKLTVQYQGLTGKEKVPRFPVGIAIRDYE